MTSNEWIIFFIGQIVTAAAIWGGIRADIRAIQERFKTVEHSTAKAHERLDRHLELDMTGPPWGRRNDNS